MSSSAKRSRLSQSPSQGEVATLIPIEIPPPVFWPGKKRATKASVKQAIKNNFEQSIANKSIWILGDDSPADEGDQFRIHERFGAFWQNCTMCKKPIHNEMNIYMYSFLQAFCSVECRDAKIAVDDIFGRSSQQRTASTPRKAGKRREYKIIAVDSTLARGA